MEDQATAAASEYMDRLLREQPELMQLDEDVRALMGLCFAYGWVTGRTAGGEEAKAIVRRVLEEDE